MHFDGRMTILNLFTSGLSFRRRDQKPLQNRLEVITNKFGIAWALLLLSNLMNYQGLPVLCFVWPALTVRSDCTFRNCKHRDGTDAICDRLRDEAQNTLSKSAIRYFVTNKVSCSGMRKDGSLKGLVDKRSTSKVRLFFCVCQVSLSFYYLQQACDKLQHSTTKQQSPKFFPTRPSLLRLKNK